MDAHRFDEIIRSLSSPSPRRGLLSGLAGGILALAMAGEAEARKRKRRCKPKCDRCERCQKGTCRKTKDGKKRCRRGKCVAKQPGTVNCGGACVNLMSDPRNCGACGRRCQLNATCSNGSCTCVNGACPDPAASCCPASASPLTCMCSSGTFQVPGTPTPDCQPVASCPPGTTACIGPFCQACCPTGSTCDTSTGTCLQ